MSGKSEIVLGASPQADDRVNLTGGLDAAGTAQYDAAGKNLRIADTQVTATSVKGTAGRLLSLSIENNAAAVRFVKIYDKATAATQADTPVLTYKLIASSSRDIPLPSHGLSFLAGIQVRGTVLLADNDTTAPTAGDIYCNIGWV